MFPAVASGAHSNLVVSDVARAVAFYRDRLGFEIETTVPEAEPYVFAIVRSGPVQIFLNAPGPAIEEYPGRGRPGRLSDHIRRAEVDRQRAVHGRGFHPVASACFLKFVLVTNGSVRFSGSSMMVVTVNQMSPFRSENKS